MENNSDWKLRLRLGYGKVQTPYTHFTVLGDGTVVDNPHGFKREGAFWLGVSIRVKY